ncbi:hypothetical protein ACLKA6_016452 [Drosophila palustris]
MIVPNTPLVIRILPLRQQWQWHIDTCIATKRWLALYVELISLMHNLRPGNNGERTTGKDDSSFKVAARKALWRMPGMPSASTKWEYSAELNNIIKW